MTVLDIQRRTGRGSKPGIRRALKRLVLQGIVLEEQMGPVFSYRLNRDHVAARWIEGLAATRAQLLDRMRDALDDFDVKPVLALLFGSNARGDGGPESDLDVMLVRPAGAAADGGPWADQLASFARETTGASGSDVRVLEFGEEELPGLAAREPVLSDVVRDGIDLTPGAGRKLERLLRVSA